MVKPHSTFLAISVWTSEIRIIPPLLKILTFPIKENCSRKRETTQRQTTKPSTQEKCSCDLGHRSADWGQWILRNNSALTGAHQRGTPISNLSQFHCVIGLKKTDQRGSWVGSPFLELYSYIFLSSKPSPDAFLSSKEVLGSKLVTLRTVEVLISVLKCCTRFHNCVASNLMGIHLWHHRM